MSIKIMIENLQSIVENPQGKVQLYFTQKRQSGKYFSYKTNTSVDLKKEIIKILLKALDREKDKAIVSFNPTGSLAETIEEYDFDSVDSLTDITESLEEGKLLTDAPDDLSKFSFYCLLVELENKEKMLFFRRITKFKKLQEGIIGQLISGELKKISSDLIGIDSQIDIIGYDSKLTIINHIAMERVFNIKAQYQESAKRTLSMIKEENRIENFSRFEDDSINDGRIIKGLTKLLKDPDKVRNCFANFDKVKELVAEVGLKINFSEDGEKLIYEGKEQLQDITLIIRDAYYQAYISERLGVDELV